MAVRVNNDTFEAEVLRSEGVILADFYSDSCVPCKRLSPVLAELEEQFENEIKLVKININFDMELAEKYEVQSVPTLVFFRGGEEISRLNGALKKGDIISEIENINKE
ncbi:MAG: thioredoxin fold domain-containing protein [Oscillospiraceae bacterium]|nr:thioredoxin fold domain-containing protein [Oscillospiraceae bacterium]